MRIDQRDAIALRAVVLHALEVVRRLDASLQSAAAPDALDERDVIGVGYWLHGLYNTLESTFEQVSRTFENHVKDKAQWHRELLDKMFLDMSPLRGAVLPPGCRGALHDLRGFRHVFRHGYEAGLDREKVRDVWRRWTEQRAVVIAALEAFAAALGDAIGA